MRGAILWFNAASIGLTLLGGLVPHVQSLLSRRGLWRMFSLRSGILLSVAFTRVLPEALSLNPAPAGWGALAAFALFFLAGSFSMVDCCPEYLEQCSVHLLGWGALTALSVHSFIDGFNLTVSFSAGALAGGAVGTALALHKLADGFTLTSLLHQSGYSRKAGLAALVGIALATPLGSLLCLRELSALPPTLTSALLGFSAGSFLYIGAADILPRIHKDRDRGNLLWFGLGLVSMAALRGV